MQPLTIDHQLTATPDDILDMAWMAWSGLYQLSASDYTTMQYHLVMGIH